MNANKLSGLDDHLIIYQGIDKKFFKLKLIIGTSSPSLWMLNKLEHHEGRDCNYPFIIT